MVLIELKQRFGNIYINPEYIASIASYGDNGSTVCIAHDNTPLIVEEKPEDILNKISTALSQ